jgi:hypothetical protein
MFRAASYYRFADFFLHGDPSDPRIMSLWKEQTACFDLAISLLWIAGQRLTIPTNHGFSIPIIFYRPNPTHKPGPTLLLGIGFDGSQEELLHIFSLTALKHSYNVLTYEGPGQHAVRRYQNKGFIVEWEHVITPSSTSAPRSLPSR